MTSQETCSPRRHDYSLARILNRHQLRKAERLGDGDAVQGVRNALEIASGRPAARPSFAAALHLDHDTVLAVRKLGGGDTGAGIRRALHEYINARRDARGR